MGVSEEFRTGLVRRIESAVAPRGESERTPAHVVAMAEAMCDIATSAFLAAFATDEEMDSHLPEILYGSALESMRTSLVTWREARKLIEEMQTGVQNEDENGNEVDDDVPAFYRT